MYAQMESEAAGVSFSIRTQEVPPGPVWAVLHAGGRQQSSLLDPEPGQRAAISRCSPDVAVRAAVGGVPVLLSRLEEMRMADTLSCIPLTDQTDERLAVEEEDDNLNQLDCVLFLTDGGPALTGKGHRA